MSLPGTSTPATQLYAHAPQQQGLDKFRTHSAILPAIPNRTKRKNHEI